MEQGTGSLITYILSIMHFAEVGSREQGSRGAVEQGAGSWITYMLFIMHYAEVGEQGALEHWSREQGVGLLTYCP